MPGKDDIDLFWELEDMIPKRPKKEPARRTVPDTDATEISLHPSKPTQKDFVIPPPKKENTIASVIREYPLENGLIRHVRILPWPSTFAFYEKFKRDALRNFHRTHPACDYVYFFSYMPQYEQMTVSQMAYYLYWREEIRKGIYLKTDINYLFLYVYEIINLPERIPPKEGAVILSRLWGAYRSDIRYLDKYLGEWLCDYCLIHRVSPDFTVLEIFLDEIVSQVSLPEFYLQNGELPFGLITLVSSYDYKKSKYYEQHAQIYDKYIPQAMKSIVNRLIMNDPDAYGIVPLSFVHDSYAGAIVCHAEKYKIETLRYAISRGSAKNAIDLKALFANMIKLCENQVRAAVGIKSRFSPTGIPEHIKKAILVYFDEALPDRNVKKKAPEEAEESYMALYEPKQNGPADISRALAIEEQAWETAVLLSTEEDIEEESLTPPEDSNPQNPFSFDIADDLPEGDFDFIRTDLSEEQRGALVAALEGSFSAYCRRIGKMEENIRGEINDIAMEYIGDMLIDSDFTVLEDYIEDVNINIKG